MSRSRPPAGEPIRFAIIGAGRVGTALGRALARSPGYRLDGVACSTPAAARRAARRIGRGRPAADPRSAAEGARLVLISVPDRAIGAVARQLAAPPGGWRGRTVLHTSGLLDASVLAPLAGRGAAVGSLHPLQSFSGRPEDARRLRGCPFGLEGSPAAMRRARALVGALGGRPVPIPPGGKTSYHLAATLLSNYLVSLVSFGLDLLPGSRKRRWIEIFAPLLHGTVDNLTARLPERALTGPISRGDRPTLRRHLQRLRREPEDAGELHRLLALRAVRLAERSGRLGAESAAAMRRLLRRSEGAGNRSGRKARRRSR